MRAGHDDPPHTRHSNQLTVWAAQRATRQLERLVSPRELAERTHLGQRNLETQRPRRSLAGGNDVIGARGCWEGQSGPPNPYHKVLRQGLS